LVEVIASTVGIFLFASLLEIGGGYLVWKWLRDHKGKTLGVIGGLILFSYGIVMTLQPADFGSVRHIWRNLCGIFDNLGLLGGQEKA
jgi:small multidrug resistance family-3 protein